VDIDGNAYLDFCGEYTAVCLATVTDILQALRRALDNGLSFAAVGEAEAKLAAILCNRFPSLDKVRFTNSGTEANLMAITAARAFTGRNKLMVFAAVTRKRPSFPLTGASQVTAPFDYVIETYNDPEGAAPQSTTLGRTSPQSWLSRCLVARLHPGVA